MDQEFYNTAPSNAHETLSIAYLRNPHTVEVLRFDQEGNAKTNLTLAFETELIELHIHNLAGDKFLLLTKDDSLNPKLRFCPEYYRVTKFDANGNRLGQIEMTTENVCGINYKKRAYVYESKSGDYCVSFFSYPQDRHLNLSYDYYLDSIVKCFSDKDFSVV